MLSCICFFLSCLIIEGIDIVFGFEIQFHFVDLFLDLLDSLLLDPWKVLLICTISWMKLEELILRRGCLGTNSFEVLWKVCHELRSFFAYWMIGWGSFSRPVLLLWSELLLRLLTLCQTCIWDSPEMIWSIWLFDILRFRLIFCLKLGAFR